MSVEELVRELEEVGVRLWEQDGNLRFRAPRGVLTVERRDALRSRKAEVLAYLRADDEKHALCPDAAARHDPFPLTDVQSAYLLGRRSAFSYGGHGCHGYAELLLDDLDPDRLQAVWQRLVERHDMLRAVVDSDGSQRVLPEVPPYEIAFTDVRGTGAAGREAALTAVRGDMDHRRYEPDQWPLFELRATACDGHTVLHISIDFLIADFVSLYTLLGELSELYRAPDRELPPVETTFRDYVLAERRLRGGRTYLRDRTYWTERVDDLPPAPELPLLDTSRTRQARFRRWQTALDEQAWSRLRGYAGGHRLTASTAVLAAYAEVVATWARRSAFTLNLTMMNRRPLAGDIDRVVGDFTSVVLLAVDHAHGETFGERARAIQDQMWRDLDHRSYSGVELIREIARRRGHGDALMPVVFTSTAGLADHDGGDNLMTDAEFGYGISQTPQVWLDCQVMERAGGASINWDVRDDVFVPGVVEDMFAAFAGLLERLANEPDIWEACETGALPARQAARRVAVNNVPGDRSECLLHDGIVATAAATPQRPAVITQTVTLTYGDLLRRAWSVARALDQSGAPRSIVAVAMDKGWEQVVAVLGVLISARAYVPVDLNQPPIRRCQMLADARVTHVLTVASLTQQSWWPADLVLVPVDALEPVTPPTTPPARAHPDDLAYVIYTSGSTGVPSGVMVNHRAAWNTVSDVSRRFASGADTRVLGLANLGFDLSVYDIFGPLALGGALVLPDASRRADPSHWADLISRFQVTLWNSVPAQLVMLRHFLSGERDVNLPSLRTAMLSGDWIPVTLPDEIRALVPQLDVVSLGGATEAAIWSVFFPVGQTHQHWRSIPYGTPLARQSLHVLDHAMRDRPEWVAGDLWIGGDGVAVGYLGDDEKTAARFVAHPRTGQRLYRTGDIARYRDDGVLDFLGREDTQVKVRGHRVELAEVTAALDSHPAVASAVALAVGETVFDRRIEAFVVPVRRAPDIAAPVDGTGLDAAARRAGEAATAGADRDTYVEFNRRLDQVALLSMLDALCRCGLFTGGSAHTLDEILGRARVAPRHHRLVRRWLAALTAHGLLGVSDGRYRRVCQVDDGMVEEAWSRVAALRHAVDYKDELITYFRTSTQNLVATLSAEQDPLQTLFPRGSVAISEAAYRENLVNRWANATVVAVLEQLTASATHDEPLRILEVGAGVGGTTVDVVTALRGAPVDYLFTDVSQFFLNQARERFDEPWLRYALFDLNDSYRAQGFTPNSFDVVVAADVLHSVVDIGEVLARLRELLRPGGRLVFIEMTRDHYQIMTSLEFLLRLDTPDGDFRDVRRGRDQTFLTRAQWHDLAATAGGEVELCLPDEGDVLAAIGMHVFSVRFKSDVATVDGERLRAHVAERVPGHMVPAHVHVLDDLPLTGNGKIDHNLLRTWLAPSEQTRAGTGDAPASEQARRLATIWSDVLDVPAVGTGDGFFDLGGDSLLAAQIAGRVRETEAPDAEFDDLLRHLLEGATVASLAAMLSDPASSPSPHGAGETAPMPAVRAITVRVGRGPVRVVLPDASCFAADLATAVADHTTDGTWIALEVVDADAVPTASAVEATRWLAARFADAVASSMPAAVEVLGTGSWSFVAVETARALAESGVAVDRVVVTGLPPALAVEDDLVVEYLYARSAGAPPECLGYPAEDEVAAAVSAAAAASPGRLPRGSLLARGDPYARLAATPPGQRHEALWRESIVAAPRPDDLAARLRVFRTLLAGAAADGVYAGDLTVVHPPATALRDLLDGDPASGWAEVCLGEIDVVEATATDPTWVGLPDLRELAGVFQDPAAGEMAGAG